MNNTIIYLYIFCFVGLVGCMIYLCRQIYLLSKDIKEAKRINKEEKGCQRK